MTSVLSRSLSSYNRVLRIDSINPRLIKTEYRHYGLIEDRYQQLKQQINEGAHLPFGDLINCGSGNLHDLGQQPITWFRQVMSLVMDPDLLQMEGVEEIFPADVIQRARYILTNVEGGVGAYSHSQGIGISRQAIANYMQAKDGGGPVDINDIFLTNGGLSAMDNIMIAMLFGEKEGLLIPYPQYRVYQAMLALHRCASVPYRLSSIDGVWSLDTNKIRKTIEKAKYQGVRTRGIVVINPGNPSAQLLSQKVMEELIQMCEQERLVLIADEVFQDNISTSEKEFVSFRKVALDLKSPVEIFSINSISKGHFAEAGLRAGYMHCHNIRQDAKLQILKLASISLCPNTIGQVALQLAMSPPQPGDESYNLYIQERNNIDQSRTLNSRLAFESLNAMTGINCNQIEGAIYIFPEVQFSEKAKAAAEERGLQVDVYYTLRALEEAGIRLVPGSAFQDLPDTYNFRMTILPTTEKMQEALSRLQAFNERFHTEFSQFPTISQNMLFLLAISVSGMSIPDGFSVSGSLTCQQFNANELQGATSIETQGSLEADSITTGLLQSNMVMSDQITTDGTVLTIESDVIVRNPSKPSSFIQQDWALIHHSDFQNEYHGWDADLSTCNGVDYFVGGHCVLSDEISRTLQLPPHSQVKVDAVYHMLDNWEGETAYLKIDDQIIWTKSGYSNSKSVSICGNGFSDPGLGIPIHRIINHNNSTLTLTFGSTLGKDPCEASFGVDDIEISVIAQQYIKNTSISPIQLLK